VTNSSPHITVIQVVHFTWSQSEKKKGTIEFQYSRYLIFSPNIKNHRHLSERLN